MEVDAETANQASAASTVNQEQDHASAVQVQVAEEWDASADLGAALAAYFADLFLSSAGKDDQASCHCEQLANQEEQLDRMAASLQ